MTNLTIRIETLACEAAQAGDLHMVAICRRALDGSQRARRECARILAQAAAACC
jgi:hypothetical protein